jgi:hypothetical protein
VQYTHSGYYKRVSRTGKSTFRSDLSGGQAWEKTSTHLPQNHVSRTRPASEAKLLQLGLCCWITFCPYFNFADQIGEWWLWNRWYQRYQTFSSDFYPNETLLRTIEIYTNLDKNTLFYSSLWRVRHILLVIYFCKYLVNTIIPRKFVWWFHTKDVSGSENLPHCHARPPFHHPNLAIRVSKICCSVPRHMHCQAFFFVKTHIVKE